MLVELLFTVVYKAVSYFFHFSSEDTALKDINKIEPVSGLLGIVGYNILISPGTGIKISNLTVSCDIKVIISNGPSWATEKPNEILIHSPFDSGNPNITVWKILEGHGFSNIKIYRRNQDVYIENLYTYSTRFSILVLSDNVNNILVSTVLLSDINLMEEEILAIGNTICFFY